MKRETSNDLCQLKVIFGGDQADLEWAEEPFLFLRRPEETSLPIYFYAEYSLRRMKAKVAVGENW